MPIAMQLGIAAILGSLALAPARAQSTHNEYGRSSSRAPTEGTTAAGARRTSPESRVLKAGAAAAAAVVAAAALAAALRR